MDNRHNAIATLVLGAAVAAMTLAGCDVVGRGCGPDASAACTHGPTDPGGGLTEAAAIEAALAHAPVTGDSAPAVIWAIVELDPFVPAGSGDPGWVWEIRLEGALDAAPCPAGLLDRRPSTDDAPCLDVDGGLVAVLDHDTGDLIGWRH